MNEQNMDTEMMIAQMRAQANVEARRPAAYPPLKFAFTEIGEQIVASLVKAADDQVKAAEDLRVEVMKVAESIGVQLEEQAKALAAMHERTKELGADVVAAHKKFLNGGPDAKA